MKLLFDQNLSFKLARKLEGAFPGSSQVKLVGLEEAEVESSRRMQRQGVLRFTKP